MQEDPELALRVYNLFRDRDVGLLFIGQYSNTQEYGASALFIEEDLSGRLDSKARQLIESKEKTNPLYSISFTDEEIKGRQTWTTKTFHSCGNKKNIGNFWTENQWDNIIILMEEQ